MCDESTPSKQSSQPSGVAAHGGEHRLQDELSNVVRLNTGDISSGAQRWGFALGGYVDICDAAGNIKVPAARIVDRGDDWLDVDITGHETGHDRP